MAKYARGKIHFSAAEWAGNQANLPDHYTFPAIIPHRKAPISGDGAMKHTQAWWDFWHHPKINTRKGALALERNNGGFFNWARKFNKRWAQGANVGVGAISEAVTSSGNVHMWTTKKNGALKLVTMRYKDGPPDPNVINPKTQPHLFVRFTGTDKFLNMTNAPDGVEAYFPLVAHDEAWVRESEMELISRYKPIFPTGVFSPEGRDDVTPPELPADPEDVPEDKNMLDKILAQLKESTGWKKVDGRWTYTRPERNFVWPTISKVVTQQFGERPEVYGQWGLIGHNGLDMRVLRSGTAINAVWDGHVTQIGTGNEGYGNYVATQGTYKGIKYVFMYAHLQFPSKLKLGDRVRAGDYIGPAGSTGFSSGAHLHFHMRVIEGPYPPEGQQVWPRQYVDPEPFFSHIEYTVA